MIATFHGGPLDGTQHEVAADVHEVTAWQNQPRPGLPDWECGRVRAHLMEAPRLDDFADGAEPVFSEIHGYLRQAEDGFVHVPGYWVESARYPLPGRRCFVRGWVGDDALAAMFG
jgi:hypothetical protein